MDFEVVGPLGDVTEIAAGPGVAASRRMFVFALGRIDVGDQLTIDYAWPADLMAIERGQPPAGVACIAFSNRLWKTRSISSASKANGRTSGE